MIILKDENIYQSFILLWNVPLGLEEKFLIICFVRVWNVSFMALRDFLGIFVVTCLYI